MSKDIQQQKKFKILLIGESCTDEYVYGEIARISPEAPVPVLKEKKRIEKLGMSGNVLSNICSMLGKERVDLFIHQNNHNKIKKIRYIDNKSNYQLMRHDIEDEIDPLLYRDIDTDQEYDVIVISDYNKGYVSKSLIFKIKKHFKNIKMFVDTKKRDISCYSWDEQRTIVKINQKERNEVVNAHMCDIITTLGAEGCEYQFKKYKANKVDVSDVCGAGDVFLAALVARWLETKDIINSIKTANNCASLSVTKVGCYTLSREEYENEINAAD
jgi:D-glycero-beta-D-manno-heptose-7-phosphate kinase